MSMIKKCCLVALSLVLAAAPTRAFVPASTTGGRTSATSLAATVENSVDRRTFAAGVAGAFAAAAVTAAPGAAVAGDYFSDYTPKFSDLQQIYVLGMTLDRLIEKVTNAEK